MSLLRVTLGRPDKFYFFEIPGEPVTWKRVGTGKYGHKYNPVAAAEKAIGWAFRAACPLAKMDPAGQWGARFAFFYGTAALARADVDNLSKNVLDALQGVVYGNDNQVRELYGITLPDTRPRTECLLYRIDADYLLARSSDYDVQSL